MSGADSVDPAVMASVFGPQTPKDAPTPEPEAPAPAPPKPAPVSGKIAASLAAERRAEKARQETAQANADREAARTEAAKIREATALASKDPIAAIKALGFKDSRAFLEHVAGDLQPKAPPSAEDVETLVSSRVEAAVSAAVTKALAEQDAQRRAQLQAQTTLSQRQQLQRDVDNAVDFVGANEAKFPTLAAMSPDMIGREILSLTGDARAAKDIVQKFGPQPTDENIAVYLEERAAARRNTWRQKFAPASAPVTSGPPETRPSQPRPPTDRDASVRVTAPRPGDPDAESIRILEAIRAATKK